MTGLLNDAANGLIGRDELAAFTDSGSGGDSGVGIVTGFSPFGSALNSDGTGGRATGLVTLAGANDCGIVNVGVAAVGVNRLAGAVTTAPVGIVVPVLFGGIR